MASSGDMKVLAGRERETNCINKQKTIKKDWHRQIDKKRNKLATVWQSETLSNKYNERQNNNRN